VTVPAAETATARIDGFTIRNGLATNGGGIYCAASAAVAIANDTITGNEATYSGGGIYCLSTAATITGNAITRNTARMGGGIDGTAASITNNTVAWNSTISSAGGGISCTSGWPVVANNQILGNSAASLAGGLYCYSASPTIVNNTIVGNSAANGGGISCYNSTSTITNNIVAFNSSGIRANNTTPVLSHNVVYGNTQYAYEGVSAGVGDLAVDPKLVAPEFGQVHLLADSPCLDAGDDAAVQVGWMDIDGQARVQSGHVDIGADEYDGTPPVYAPTIVRVSPTGDDAWDGSTWALAKRTVQAALDAVVVGGGEVWVAAGTYDERIVLQGGVYLYGGFAGTEEARAERDWTANASILDGGAGGSVVQAANCGYRLSTLDGFTVRNGAAVNGGGVYCSVVAPTIANNTITGNSATGAGGGVYAACTPVVITGNTVSGNSASNGAGIYYSSAISGAPLSCTPVIARNTISANTANATTGEGGGLYCADSSATITGNSIRQNSAARGGGIRCMGTYSSTSATRITQNTIAENSAAFGAGVNCAAAPSYYTPPVISDNTIFGNTATGDGQGGGVYCADTSPIITGNLITNNSATAGAGINSASSGSPLIANNTISRNRTAGYGTVQGGAGICVSTPTAVIANNAIVGNSAESGYGGGIYA